MKKISNAAVLLLIFLSTSILAGCSHESDDPVAPPEKAWSVALKCENVKMNQATVVASSAGSGYCRFYITDDTLGSLIVGSLDILPDGAGVAQYTFKMLHPATKYYYQAYSIGMKKYTAWQSLTTTPAIRFSGISMVRQGTSADYDGYPWADADVAMTFSDSWQQCGAYFVWNRGGSRTVVPATLDLAEEGGSYKNKYWRPSVDVAFDDTVKTAYVYYPYVSGVADRSTMKIPVNTFGNENYLYATFPVKHIDYAPVFMQSVMTQLRLKVGASASHTLQQVTLFSRNIATEGLLDLTMGKIAPTSYESSRTLLDLDRAVDASTTIYSDKFMIPQAVADAYLIIRYDGNTEKRIDLGVLSLVRNSLCSLTVNIDAGTCVVNPYDFGEAK